MSDPEMREGDMWIMIREDGSKVFVCDYKHLLLRIDDYRDMMIAESPDDAADAMVGAVFTKTFLADLPLMDCGPMPPREMDNQPDG